MAKIYKSVEELIGNTLSGGSAAGFAKGLASGRRIGYYTGDRIFPSGAAGRASR